MDLIMKPELYDFQDMSQYAEWLHSHSDEIPKRGQVLIFRLHAEDFCWLKFGDGKHKVSDLPRTSMKGE